jgi:WD40 repeat protein
MILEGHTGDVQGVAFSPNGQRLVTVSGGEIGDDIIRLWDVATGHQQNIVEGHTDAVTTMAFSTDGKLLASGDLAGKIRLWDIETLSQQAIWQGHDRSVSSLAFNPEGTLLASSSGDGIVLWETGTWRERVTLWGHTGQAYHLAFSPNGTFLAGAGCGEQEGSSCVFGEVRVWELSTVEQVATFQWDAPSLVHGLAFSPDSDLLAIASQDSSVRLWNVSTDTEPSIWQLGSEISNWVYDVEFSPDGQWLAAGIFDGTVRLWDVAGSHEQSVFSVYDEGEIFDLAFNPDGTLIAAGGGDGDNTVRLWEINTGRERTSLEGHTTAIGSVVFSPGGKLLASGSWDGTIRLWGIPTSS